MVVLIKGAGDLASGIALRLYRSDFKIVMTDIEQPTTVRCTVAFSPSIYEGEAVVEGVCAKKANNISEINAILNDNNIAVIADEKAEILQELNPHVLVDAILAKKNLGTKITDAPVVIGVGPGFTAGED